MKIEIHRGQNQIGGNIVEISTQTTRILLDVGQELDEETPQCPAIEGLFVNADFDAVFITHYHLDHLGLAYEIDRKIPLYLGEGSFRVVQTMDRRMKQETFTPAGFLKNQEPIIIGDITVTPFLCDHSAFDSYMLLCEAEGKRVLYTGDFRANGRKSFSRLLDRLPRNVDVLICEGTTLSRGSFTPVTETELEDQAVSLFRETAGPIFVLQATTNIDRIVTMYRAAKRSDRVFLEGLPMAAVTSAIGGSIPNPAFRDVFAYKTAYEPYEELCQYDNRMGKARMANTPFVMCIRSSMLSYLKRLAETVNVSNGVLVYSMWNGYREKPQMQAFLEGCVDLGLKIVTLHTTGHADAATIQQLIDHTAPQKILPIHTEVPLWFEGSRNV